MSQALLDTTELCLQPTKFPLEKAREIDLSLGLLLENTLNIIRGESVKYDDCAYSSSFFFATSAVIFLTFIFTMNNAAPNFLNTIEIPVKDAGDHVLHKDTPSLWYEKPSVIRCNY